MYPWGVPVFTYEPQVFTWREQFLRALTGFVSCVGINLLAKTLVVCEIIVIQNVPSTHVFDARALFKSNAERAVEEEKQLLALSSAS